jgi:hypothetical protein
MGIRRFILVAALLFGAFLPPTAIAGSSGAALRFHGSPALAVTDLGRWKKVQDGLELRRMSLERSQPRQVVSVHLVRFDSQWMIPHIVYGRRYNLNGADVKTLAEKSGAVAAINGNYFDEKGKPLGYLKALAQKLNSRVSNSALFTGIFGVKNRQPFIVHRDRFDPQETDEGLQAGPLLLSAGQPLNVTRGADKRSRRALIGTDTSGRWIIAVVDSVLGGLAWAEIQELFASAQWEIRAVELLNLDGGGSAQLYVKSAAVEEYVPGRSPVPVAVGFFPKER